jgi:hypothetical protein
MDRIVHPCSLKEKNVNVNDLVGAAEDTPGAGAAGTIRLPFRVKLLDRQRNGARPSPIGNSDFT